MSAIASSRKYLPELGLAAFMALCLAAMVTTEWPTVPFHFIWVSVTVMFGIRMWTRGPTWIWLGIVMVTTGFALYTTVNGPGGGGVDEMTEVPLMGLIFAITVWQVRTRQRATDEMRRMAERERSVLEAQRGFVLDSAHSLRTPITIARGHAELIQEEALIDRTRSDATIIIEELDRLSRMSARLLLLVAAEQPEFLHTQRVDVRDLMRRCAARWDAAAPRAWAWRVDADGSIDVDEERLALALDAVIENAVKHTPDGGWITIAVTARGQRLLISIEDDGSGIPQDDLAKVFDRFAHTAGPGGGTGLGLPIAQAIVHAHGGTIAVASSRGTIVTIELPGYRVRGATPAVDPAPEPGPARASAGGRQLS
jgi:signal transduction histidine kinase